jgi:hypothetical protein
VFRKINFKSILIGIIIGIVLSSSVFAGEEIMQYIFTQSNCKLIVDGQEYNNPDIPITLFMKDNSNFAPLAVVRDLCNKLDVPFVYDNVTKEIRITTTSVTTTDNLGKEETSLMSETNITTDKVTYRKDENGLMIVTQNGVDYVGIDNIETYILSKHNDSYNTYFFKYDETTNTSYIENSYKEKITIETPSNVDIKRENIVLLKDIPCFKIKTDGIKIKYDYYLNSILPLFDEESSN